MPEKILASRTRALGGSSNIPKKELVIERLKQAADWPTSNWPVRPGKKIVTHKD